VRRQKLRTSILFSLLLLGACAHQNAAAWRGRQPSLKVADVAMQSGAPAMALSVTQEILAKDPANVPALVRQGNALYSLNRTAQAADAYQRALAIEPRDEEALVGLARVRLTDDPGAAERLLRKAVAHDPRNATAQNDLGIACDLQGRHRDAQEAYRRALAASPDLVAAEVNLGLSLALGGRADQGVAMLQPLAAGEGASPRVRQDLAAALVLDGQTDQAERLLGSDLSQAETAEAVMGYAALRP